MSLLSDVQNVPELRRKDLNPDPFAQFELWFAEHLAKLEPSVEPTAMALATADEDGRPAQRMVLLKGMSRDGFQFFTNYGSRKAEHLSKNPHAALLFYWPHTLRQVRVEGPVKRMDAAASDAYFASRTRASQLAAIASDQSRAIGERDDLLRTVAELDANNPGPLARPNDWGGFVLRGTYFEFWQGRPHRLHDRFAYRPPSPDEATQQPSDEWIIERMAP